MEVWQRACQLICRVYRVGERGTLARDFALRDQMRRAAISVASNIAEGFERDSPRAFSHMLSISKGSSGELRTQLYVAAKLGHIDAVEAKALIAEAEEISRMLAGVIRHLKNRQSDGTAGG